MNNLFKYAAIILALAFVYNPAKAVGYRSKEWKPITNYTQLRLHSAFGFVGDLTENTHEFDLAPKAHGSVLIPQFDKPLSLTVENLGHKRQATMDDVIINADSELAFSEATGGEGLRLTTKTDGVYRIYDAPWQSLEESHAGGYGLEKLNNNPITNNTRWTIRSPGFTSDLSESTKGFRLAPGADDTAMIPQYNKPLSLPIRSENLGREAIIEGIIVKENSTISLNELQGTGVRLYVITPGEEEQIIDVPLQ